MPVRQKIEDLGGRRFIAAMVSGAGTWGLCAFGIIDAAAYVTATLGVVGAYIAGNTWQKVSTSPGAQQPPSAEQ